MYRDSKIKNITSISILAAFVFITSKISMPINLGLGNTRIHFGNIMCIISGFILSPINGGLSSGIGSFLFDLTDPLYISSSPFTFISKFCLSYVSGKMSKRKGLFVSAFIGSCTYIVIYIAKTFLDNAIISMPLSTNITVCFQKLIISSINAIFAIFISVPLTKSINKRVSKK